MRPGATRRALSRAWPRERRANVFCPGTAARPSRIGRWGIRELSSSWKRVGGSPNRRSRHGLREGSLSISGSKLAVPSGSECLKAAEPRRNCCYVGACAGGDEWDRTLDLRIAKVRHVGGMQGDKARQSATARAGPARQDEPLLPFEPGAPVVIAPTPTVTKLGPAMRRGPLV